ncbi:MAG: hypothetical protein H0V30_01745 [Chitinophagaceae bacterium]|jgi:hypothetical protein|nr:hypothetical protein [Chitinophagaceae bacterium]
MKDELKNKIYNCEIKPPGNNWTAIANALDDGVKASFPTKLFSYETPPPAEAWNKIANKLDNISEAAIIPVYKKAFPVWRYAAAAAIIGIIALSVFWMTDGSNTINNDMATKPDETVTPKTNNLPVPLNKPSIAGEVNEDWIENDENKTEKWVAKNSYREKYPDQNTYAVATMDDLRNAPAQLSYSFSVDNMDGNLQPLDYSARNISYNPSQVATNNPYVTVISEDGYVIRISKKLAGMIGCLDNEPSLNNIDCKAKIQKWREQIASSPITPSPDNFLDMLSLINSIKENTP